MTSSGILVVCILGQIVLCDLIVLLFQDGSSALMLASTNGHTDIVKYLIEARASLDLQQEVQVVYDL